MRVILVETVTGKRHIIPRHNVTNLYELKLRLSEIYGYKLNDIMLILTGNELKNNDYINFDLIKSLILVLRNAVYNELVITINQYGNSVNRIEI